MLKSLLTAAAASAAMIASASAATVTVGSITFDDSQYADAVTVLAGTVLNANNAVDGDIETRITQNGRFDANAFGAGDMLRFDFDGASLANGAGFDIIVFEFGVGENSNVALNMGGQSVLGSLIEVTSFDFGNISAYGYDLSDFGLAAGALAGNSLFFTAADGVTPNLAEIIGVNFGAEVPLPGAALFLATGLVGAAAARRRAAKA